MVENLKTSETSLKAGLTYWLYVVSLVSNWRLLRFIFFIFLDLLNTATTCNVEPESCLCLRLLLMAVGLRPYGKVAASELLLFLVYCSPVWVIRAAGRNGKGFLPFLSLPGDLVSPPPPLILVLCWSWLGQIPISVYHQHDVRHTLLVVLPLTGFIVIPSQKSHLFANCCCLSRSALVTAKNPPCFDL